VDPEVVLMDEAFSAIDEVTADILREEVAEKGLDRFQGIRPAQLKQNNPDSLLFRHRL
jgi:hypothetical protein